MFWGSHLWVQNLLLIFFYCKPEASYITYPSYTELSYTALFWNSLYMVYFPWTGGSGQKFKTVWT